MNRTLVLITVAALAALAAERWQRRPIEHPPGILVPEAPEQQAVGESVFRHGDYVLIRRARFHVRARVLSTERYFLGREADLSPLDLALGWGVMSDQARLNRIEVSQGSRWYYTRFDSPAPLSPAEITRHSGNMHMIPATDRIAQRLKRLRSGDLVALDGYLVDVRHPSGWNWSTSLSRTDTGSGACEIFYVESMSTET